MELNQVTKKIQTKDFIWLAEQNLIIIKTRHLQRHHFPESNPYDYPRNIFSKPYYTLGFGYTKEAGAHSFLFYDFHEKCCNHFKGIQSVFFATSSYRIEWRISEKFSDVVTLKYTRFKFSVTDSRELFFGIT